MKVTGKPHSTAALPSTEELVPDAGADLKTLHRATAVTRRKARNLSLIRQRRSGVPAGKRSRPETPLLKWKVEDRGRERNGSLEDDGGNDLAERETRRRGPRKSGSAVSARKLAAGLWHLQNPDTVASAGERKSRDRLGFQADAGYLGVPFLYHHIEKIYGHEGNDPRQSLSSVAATKNGFLCKLEPTIPFSHSAMEGTTKWDPVCLETMDDARKIYSHMKRVDQQVNAVSLVSSLEAEIEEARARIEELETEKRSQKKKLEQFLRKVSEERAAWRSREHEKIRALIDDITTDLNREKKNRQRIEIVNSKLVNELADAKLTAKRYMQDKEKERKARELVEEVCDDLAKEIGEDKAEVEALKRESMKLREEVEEERKMLQIAEVWREERVQMKLVDAKVALEERYSQMKKLVADLETFLRSRSSNTEMREMREAESLRQAASLVDIQDVKEFMYEPPNPDDIFSVFDGVNFGESHEREIEQCVAYSPASHASRVHSLSPEVNMMNNKVRHLNVVIDQNDEIEEDESGWETVSHLEEQGSSYSPEGSTPVNRNRLRDSNVSMSGTEWEADGCEDTPVTDISEVCSAPRRQSKKVLSIAKLWRACPNNKGENCKIISVEGVNARVSNGRKSNTSVISSDRGSAKGGGFSPLELVGQWSSPDSANPHVTHGMKGCIEWPRYAQKNSLKAKLLEARIESQKLQLRHVLKQKI